MVVEHVFVTTWDWSDVRLVANDLLSRHGFAGNLAEADVIGMRRSRKAMKRLTPALSQMDMRLTFDRGRITLAIAMEDGQRSFGMNVSRVTKKIKTRRADYLIALANTIDATLTGKETTDAASESIFAFENEVIAVQRRAKRIAYIFLAILFVVIPAFIVLMAVFSSHR